MKYVSIDIETTGLDPERDQVLEFAAVFDCDDYHHLPIERLPYFRRVIARDRIEGSPMALAMNAKLIAEIAGGGVHVHEASLVDDFRSWLCGTTGQPVTRVTPAGKNFGSFDGQFLKRLGFDHLFHHRCLDPGSMFPDLIRSRVDDTLPSLKDIGDYLGVEWPEHTALGDARAVVYAVRAGLNRGTLIWGTNGRSIQAAVQTKGAP